MAHRQLRGLAYRRAITQTAFVWTEAGRKVAGGLKAAFQSFLLNTHIDASAGMVFVPPMPDDYLYNLIYEGFMKVMANAGGFKLADEIDLPEEVLDYLRDYIPTIWKNLEKEIIDQIETVLRNSMLEGLSIWDREQEVAKLKLQEITKQRIDMIIRTEITRADNLARVLTGMRDDEVAGFRFTAVLDDRTSDICMARHGLYIAKDDPALAENTPPLHVRCRSMLIGVSGGDFEKMSGSLPAGQSRESYRDIIRAIQML